MRISPSQYVTYASVCPRKWWWQSVRRMPAREDRTTQAIGTVFHAVAERWLLADDQGRDRSTGLPVDCFPEGWEVATERDGSSVRLDAVQQQLVREMFEHAVALGVLRRLPGRQVEHEFVVPVCDGVDMVGVVDQRNPDVVEDHKTVGGRRWAMTPKDLREDPKSLCYAHAQRVDFPRESAAGVRLRINNVDKKDPRNPWAVETEPLVSHAEIDRFWQEKVVPTALEMVELRGRKFEDADWRQVEGPRSSDACTKYNKPCPFSRVCAGRTEPEQLRAQNAPKEPRKPGMGVFGKKKSPASETPASPAQETSAPPQSATAVADPQVDQFVPCLVDGRVCHSPEEKAYRESKSTKLFADWEEDQRLEKADPAERSRILKEREQRERIRNGESLEVVLGAKMSSPPAPAREAPPWHTPGCQACVATPGINSKGLPCRACDTVSGRSGRPQSKDFRVWHDEKGNLRWTKTDGAASVTPPKTEQASASSPPSSPLPAAPVAVSESALAPTPPKKERKSRAAPATPPVAVVNVTNEAPAPTLQDAAKASVLAVTEPGFVLHINCVPLQQDFIDLSVLLAMEMQELAEGKGVGSAYELDAFKRRDILAAHAPQVASQLLQGKNVVALGGSADLKAYVDALRPLATRVVVGCF